MALINSIQLKIIASKKYQNLEKRVIPSFLRIKCGVRLRYPRQIVVLAHFILLSRFTGAVFDIDEYLVLHEDTCVNTFVEKFKAPGLALTWAMFLLELPLDSHSRTGNYHKQLRYRAHEGPAITTTISPESIILPHDMIQRRQYECGMVKTIARIDCVDTWKSPHFPVYKSCPYTGGPMDPLGHVLRAGADTPYVDNSVYRVAQLNHYWTLSLAHFLRKIHRG